MSVPAEEANKETYEFFIDWQANFEQLNELAKFKSDSTIRQHLVQIINKLSNELKKEGAYLKLLIANNCDLYARSKLKSDVLQERSSENFQPENAFDQKSLRETRALVIEDDVFDVKKYKDQLSDLDRIKAQLQKFKADHELPEDNSEYNYSPYITQVEIKLILSQYYLQQKKLNSVKETVEKLLQTFSAENKKYFDKEKQLQEGVNDVEEMYRNSQLLKTNSTQKQHVDLARHELKKCTEITERLEYIKQRYLELKKAYSADVKAAAALQKQSHNSGTAATTATTVTQAPKGPVLQFTSEATATAASGSGAGTVTAASTLVGANTATANGSQGDTNSAASAVALLPPSAGKKEGP